MFVKVYMCKLQFICGHGRVAPKRTVIIEFFKSLFAKETVQMLNL